MLIRKANKEDLEHIIEIENKVYPEKFRETLDCYTERMNVFNDGFVVAIENNEIIGYCSTEKWKTVP